MKTIFKIAILAFAAVWMAACGAPATNTNTNTNTNTTKPTAAAPTADALLALDKQANEAYIKGDSKFFADTLKDWAGNCDIKSVNLTDTAGTTLSPTVGILTSKGTAEGSCYDQKLAPSMYMPHLSM